MTLPTDRQARKDIPIVTGVLDYFPDALAEIAKVSLAGNKQHNGDQPLHWARGKSMDHADTIVRHLMERGTLDTDGMRHSAKVAWRALAQLQQELEDAGAAMSRGSWMGCENIGCPLQGPHDHSKMIGGPVSAGETLPRPTVVAEQARADAAYFSRKNRGDTA